MPDEEPHPQETGMVPSNPAPPLAEAGVQWPVLQMVTLAGPVAVDPNHKFKSGVLPMVTEFVKAHPWSRELSPEERHERWQTFLRSLAGVYGAPSPTLVIEAISSPGGEASSVITDQSRIGDYWIETQREDGTPLETPVLHMNKYSLFNMLTAFRVYQLATEAAAHRGASTPEGEEEEGPGTVGQAELIRQAYSWSASLFYRAAPNRFIRQVHAGHIVGIDPDSVTSLLDRTRHVAGPTCPGCRLAEDRRRAQEQGNELRQMFSAHEERERDDLSMYM